MKKYIALMTTALLAASMVSSCGKAANSSSGHHWQNSETLNEWQIDLLESQGLPTDIEQLSPSQKRSIQHIYEMITYLNEKYDEEFVYAGYVEPGVMDEETLYARSLSDKNQRSVTVTIDDNGDFTDDYQGASVADYCEKLIGDYIKDYFKSDEVAYYMSNFNSDINDIKDVENGNFNWDIGIQNVLFFSDTSFKAEDLEVFVPEFAKWLYEHKISADNRLNIIKNVDIKSVTSSNNDKCYKIENNVFFIDMRINEKRVTTCKSSDREIEHFDTDEYVNKELN